MNTSVTHLDNLVLFQVDFDIWSAQVRLEDPDIKLGVGGELPPKEIAKLGSKYVLDKAHLRQFNRLKAKARRLCLSYGMTFLNGYAIAANKADIVIEGLKDIAVEMSSIKSDFLANYEDYIIDWKHQNPEYASVIEAGTLPIELVESKIGFDYQAYKIGAINNEQDTRLNKKASGLGNELINEIVKEANDFFIKNLNNKSDCSLKTKKTLCRLRDKVDSLSFLDGRLYFIVKLLDESVKLYGEKKLEGLSFYRLLTIISVLSSKERITEYTKNNTVIFNETPTNLMDGVKGDVSHDEDGITDVQPAVDESGLCPFSDDDDLMSNDIYF